MLRSSAVLCVCCALSMADVSTATFDFSADPEWEGDHNVPPPDKFKTTTQDFGYGATQFNGAVGEIGGAVSRSLTAAKYQKPIAPKSLNDRFAASGTFVIPSCSGGSGVLVGFFNKKSNGWRTPNSLVFRVDSDGNRYRIFFEYGTQSGKTGGGATFQEPYQQHRDDVIVAGPAVHTWRMEYDPQGNDNNGEIIFTLDGKPYRAGLGPGHKADGAVFDRFGIMNIQVDGDPLQIFLGNLVINDEPQDLSSDPEWEGSGNRVTFRDSGIRPLHDFTWRNTAYAGGAPGEIGGRIWRIEEKAPQDSCSYGVPVGALTLEQPLAASGKVSFHAAAADSALVIGWYNKSTLPGGPPANCLGVLVEGPSAAGHYFRPVIASATGKAKWADHGPVIHPDRATHKWALAYDPVLKSIRVTLDTDIVDMPVPEDIQRDGATFDHFGVFSWLRGGHFVEMYFDDLTFSTSK